MNFIQKKSISIFSILLFLSSHIAFSQLSAKEIKVKIEKQMGEAVKREYGGTAIVAVKDGSIIYEETYGMSNMELNIPVTNKTVFHIASVSKQFTAFAIAQLLVAGKIQLTDNIKKYLDYIPEFKNTITIENLIYHTSGLREWSSSLYLAGRSVDDSFTNNDVKRMVSKQKALNFEPGTQFGYNNTGYTLMAEIVAKVSGMSFGDYMKKNVFEPLGMNNTFVRENSSVVIPNVAQSYILKNKTFFVDHDNLAVSGSAGVYSSISDLAKWGANFHSHNIGGNEVFELMKRRGHLKSGEIIPYTFGTWPSNFYGTDWIDHTGSWAGFRAYSTYFPEHNLSIFTLQNFDVRHNAGQYLSYFLLKDKLETTAEENGDDKKKKTKFLTSNRKSKDLVGTYFLDDKYLTIEVINDTIKSSIFPKSYGAKESTNPTPIKIEGKYLLVDGIGKIKMSKNSDSAIEYQSRIYNKIIPSEEINLKNYTGKYYSEELDVIYNVYLDEKVLKIENLNNGSFPLMRIRYNEFDVDANFMDFIQFKQNENGEVVSMEIFSERSRHQVFTKI